MEGTVYDPFVVGEEADAGVGGGGAAEVHLVFPHVAGGVLVGAGFGGGEGEGGVAFRSRSRGLFEVWLGVREGGLWWTWWVGFFGVRDYGGVWAGYGR